MFNLKVSRFNLLSESAAIAYHWGDFLEFGEQHEHITKKLTCLIHNAMDVEYISIILVVITTFRVI